MELVISANYTQVIVLEQGFENDFKLLVAKFQNQILIFSFKMLILIKLSCIYWLLTSFDICKYLNHLIVFL